ncbi:MAG: hypothetical protein QOK15_2288 [Nocardioidaceae bacterium]|jgi:ABC-type transporter Mla MlaB component|nr:hypothetical protein [Nocardioidaceae bacterium]
MIHDSLVFRFTRPDVLAAPPTCGLLTIPDFLRQVQKWCVDRGPALIVDLSEVQEADMAVLRALLWARRQCKALGRDLYVVEPPVGVLRPAAEPLLRSLLQFYPDVLSAERAIDDEWAPIPA